MAKKIEAAPETEDEISDLVFFGDDDDDTHPCFNQGSEAALAGMSEDLCPYHGGVEREEWLAGYDFSTETGFEA